MSALDAVSVVGLIVAANVPVPPALPVMMTASCVSAGLTIIPEEPSTTAPLFTLKDLSIVAIFYLP